MKYLSIETAGPRFEPGALAPCRAWPANNVVAEADIWASGVSVATRNYLERHRLVGCGPRAGKLTGESIIEHWDEENYEDHYQEVRHVQEVRTDGYLATDQGMMAIRQTHRNQTVVRSPKKVENGIPFRDERRVKRAPEKITFNSENLKNLPKLLPKRN